jgi:hypothetical protein
MRFFAFLLLSFVLASSGARATLVFSPSSEWKPVTTSSGNPFDYANDQQTGTSTAEADIVGSATFPGFYWAFNDNGSASDTDGEILFRSRQGADGPPPAGNGTFDQVLFVGIDGNGDGALDVFVGADNASPTEGNKIWDAGTGANISPSTTSIQVPAPFVYAHTAANFNFSTVSAIDPAGTDVDGDGRPDFFVSFLIPFPDLVAAMNALAGISITDTTALSFVLATSTQANALNQDLGAINGAINSTSTWSVLGGLSDPISPAGDGFEIPEPHTMLLVGFGLVGLGLADRKRRLRHLLKR